MKFKVKGYVTLRKAMDNKAVLEIEMANATISDLLRHLSNRFGKDFNDLMFDPGTGEISRHIRVLVNGRHYSHLPNLLDTKLKEGDEVALFPPVAGG